MNKTVYAIVVGIALIAGLVGGLLGTSLSKTPARFGAEGDTNLTNLVLSGTLSAVSAITQTSLSAINQLLGTTLMNEAVFCASGYSLSVSTSTTLTPAQFVGTCHYHIVGTSAVSTTTLAAATSSWVAAGSGSFGSYSQQELSNDSTNTVNFVAGTGMTFRCPTASIGTTTNSNAACTATQFSLNASSSMTNIGYWTASGTMYVQVGPMYH